MSQLSRNDIVDNVRKIISTNQYMALATADRQPWIAPLYYAIDNNYHLYFISALNSRHSIGIKVNPHVAIAIYNTCEPPESATAVLILGKAGQAEISLLPTAMHCYYLKRFPNGLDYAIHKHTVDDFIDSVKNVFQRRLYYVIPTDIFMVSSLIDAEQQPIRVNLQDIVDYS